MLNVAYPDALHVRTAVWMAQREGVIPADAQLAAGDPQTATIHAMFRLRETVVRLGALRDRVGATLDGRPVPAFSLILIGPMLWTRFEQAGTALQMTTHVAGPELDDVVVVTDAPVVAAMAEGLMTPRAALELGLVRFYGVRDRVDVVVSLFDPLAPATNAAVAGRPRS
jgi:hypothetical protein